MSKTALSFRRGGIAGVAACLAASGFAAACFAAPDLTPGVWKNITPPAAGVSAEDHVFCQGMAIDPSQPSTLYLCVCAYDVEKGAGLYKTTDGGSTWKRVGHLDEPIHVVVDPKNSKHLYAVDGVRGSTLGFWVSEDGGETWTQPAGFAEATNNTGVNRDVYHVAVAPENFAHVLVSFHSPWGESGNAGVLESKDGGMTWTAHQPPAGSKGGYGMSVFFLHFPQHKMGNENTWLFTAQAGGFFRTEDAGKTWSQVYEFQMTHGGNQIYCAKNGVLYSGGYQYPARSTDNGKTWAQVKTGLDYSWYMGVAGDGNFIYLGGTGENRPFFVSPETDGVTWQPYRGGTQTFSSQPFEMFYDSANGIVYSSSWDGLYALKVTDPNSPIRSNRAERFSKHDALNFQIHRPGLAAPHPRLRGRPAYTPTGRRVAKP